MSYTHNKITLLRIIHYFRIIYENINFFRSILMSLVKLMNLNENYDYMIIFKKLLNRMTSIF